MGAKSLSPGVWFDTTGIPRLGEEQQQRIKTSRIRLHARTAIFPWLCTGMGHTSFAQFKTRFFSLRSKVMTPSWAPKGYHVSRTHVSPSLVNNRELKQKRRRRRRRSKRRIKMSSRFSNLNLSVGSEYFWSWILNDSSKLRKRKRKSWIKKFFKVVVVKRRQRNVPRVWCTCKVVVLLI